MFVCFIKILTGGTLGWCGFKPLQGRAGKGQHVVYLTLHSSLVYSITDA